MKTYFQISLKVFTVLLTVMLVCVGCGKNGNSASGSGLLGGMSEEDKCNPVIRFTSYKPIYEVDTTAYGASYYRYNKTEYYHFRGIKVYDANGEIKYSDEEAEKYYDHYAAHFLYACIIANKVCNDADMRSYMEEHLFEVVRDLPLSDSYPSNVQEIANKIYYDYKDRAFNMTLTSRGYGYLVYEYSSGTMFGGSYVTKYLKVYREQDSGALVANIYETYKR